MRKWVLRHVGHTGWETWLHKSCSKSWEWRMCLWEDVLEDCKNHDHPIHRNILEGKGRGKDNWQGVVLHICKAILQQRDLSRFGFDILEQWTNHKYWQQVQRDPKKQDLSSQDENPLEKEERCECSDLMEGNSKWEKVNSYLLQ